MPILGAQFSPRLLSATLILSLLTTTVRTHAEDHNLEVSEECKLKMVALARTVSTAAREIGPFPIGVETTEPESVEHGIMLIDKIFKMLNSSIRPPQPGITWGFKFTGDLVALQFTAQSTAELCAQIEALPEQPPMGRLMNGAMEGRGGRAATSFDPIGEGATTNGDPEPTEYNWQDVAPYFRRAFEAEISELQEWGTGEGRALWDRCRCSLKEFFDLGGDSGGDPGGTLGESGGLLEQFLKGAGELSQRAKEFAEYCNGFIPEGLGFNASGSAIGFYYENDLGTSTCSLNARYTVDIRDLTDQEAEIGFSFHSGPNSSGTWSGSVTARQDLVTGESNVSFKFTASL